MVTVGSPGAKTSEPTKAASVSSESESEEEAEYHPNVSVTISHTQIPEEKEEELELEQKEKKEEKLVEQDAAAPDVTSAPAEISQPVEATCREEEEAQTVMKSTEEEKEEQKEVVGSDEVPVIPPEEAPNGLTVLVEAATEVPAHTQEEEEPKVNGEASLAEAESRPQVICCSEVTSSLGLPWSFPRLRPFLQI